MNINETINLLRKVRAFCPSQRMDDYTPEAWQQALNDMPYADADEALVWIMRQPLELGKSRYIEPGHLIGVQRDVQRERVKAFGEIEAPSEAANLVDFDAEMLTDSYRYRVLPLIRSGHIRPGDQLPSLSEVGIVVKALTT